MKDATIELIGEVIPHPNADRLDLVKILGFQCVTQKGLYQGGEKVVYIRPDAVLPELDWAVDYRKYSPKRIKAVKLRDRWSEGIIVPFEILPVDLSNFEVGSEVTEVIGVTHYEPPVPQDLQAKRALPFGIPKTDEERWENLIDQLPIGNKVDITLKVDGQSWSIYYNILTDEFGVLGRTLEYNIDGENRYSVHVLKTYPDLKEKFIAYCKFHNKSICLRGESYGNGIQGFDANPHAKLKSDIAIFSCYLIDDRKYANKGSEFYFEKVSYDLGLPTVKFLEKDVELTNELIQKYSADLEKIDGNYFEGVVVKHENGSFKIISKKYDSIK